ncbi:hypothetical protein Hanom_Chr07g00610961 [Helianthus anomalus]
MEASSISWSFGRLQVLFNCPSRLQLLLCRFLIRALFKPFQLTVQAVCRCFLCRFHHMSKSFDYTCSNKVTVPCQTTFKPG